MRQVAELAVDRPAVLEVEIAVLVDGLDLVEGAVVEPVALVGGEAVLGDPYGLAGRQRQGGRLVDLETGGLGEGGGAGAPDSSRPGSGRADPARLGRSVAPLKSWDVLHKDDDIAGAVIERVTAHRLGQGIAGEPQRRARPPQAGPWP